MNNKNNKKNCVVIIGRPNVGKSTLFNRLTNTRNAIVADIPGVTRDRQYGIAKFNGQDVIVIDTGGIQEKAHNQIESLMASQTKMALLEASLILFLIDAKIGVRTEDSILAKKLHKLNKSVVVVLNKADNESDDVNVVGIDLYSFGFGEPIKISAEHNLGIRTLKRLITTKLSLTQLAEPESLITETSKNALKIAIIGRPNVGKSTLINCILGQERMIVCDQPGTTRDSIFIDFSCGNKDYVLIDTAGIRRRSKTKEKIEKFSVIKALQAIEIANVAVFMFDATESIADQDLKLLGFVLDSGRALVIAVNKWDSIALQQRKQTISELKRRIDFIAYAKICFISALNGKGIGALFCAIDASYLSATKKLKTAEVTKTLEKAIANFQPPLVNGKEIKLRYAHVGKHNPPTIIIYGSRTKYLPKSYCRYLEKFFRKEFDLFGTPIKILFKE